MTFVRFCALQIRQVSSEWRSDLFREAAADGLARAATPPGAPSDVRLHLETARPGPCTQLPEQPSQPPGLALLPVLYAPEGVAVDAVGAGGGPNRWTTEATAQTDHSVAELEAHVAQQLAAAGWLRQAGAAQGPLAWSTWTLPGTDLTFAFEQG